MGLNRRALARPGPSRISSPRWLLLTHQRGLTPFYVATGGGRCWVLAASVTNLTMPLPRATRTVLPALRSVLAPGVPIPGPSGERCVRCSCFISASAGPVRAGDRAEDLAGGGPRWGAATSWSCVAAKGLPVVATSSRSTFTSTELPEAGLPVDQFG